MNRSNLMKVIVVFVAAVVVTMVSLVYSSTQKANQLREAVQNAGSERNAAPAEAPMTGNRDRPASARSGQEHGDAIPGDRRRTEPDRSTNSEVPVQRTQPTKPDLSSESASENAQNTAVQHEPITVVSPNAPGLSASGINDSGRNAPPVGASIPLETPPPKREEATASRPAPRVMTLQPGSNISIRLGQSLSTDRNHAGDIFRGTLDSPLIVNGVMLADRGSSVRGEVVRVKRARFLRAKSDLSLILTEISMSDGQRVRVETGLWEEKGARRGIEDTPRMAAGAALGVVVGALHGAARGSGLVSSDEKSGTNRMTAVNKKTVLLTTGSRLTFRLASPVTITERFTYR